MTAVLALRRPIAVTIAALLAAVAVLVWHPPAARAADAGAEADFVARINTERTSRGLGALTVDGQLTSIARAWSTQMASSNHLSHNPNLSSQVTEDWQKLGENVGVGPTVADIHQAFMNSPAHRANILDPAFTYVGLGVVVAGDGSLWVTEVFMQLRAAAPASPPAAPATTASPSVPIAAPRAARSTPTTTAPPPTTTTTEPPAPAVEAPPPPPPPPPQASPRLVLVLSGLAALGAGE
ncbi:MAG TPA: CAP domain-containing protein [Acidimicrobiales bacterium]|nr:CAP domain-containing protein [Acidimicrobiales bacterium]